MSDEKNDVPPERIWIEFAEPWGIQSWASDPDWAAAEISRGRKLRAFIDQSALTAMRRERDDLSDQLDKAVSPEYLASALAAVNAVDGEWKSRAEAAESKVKKMRKALRPLAEAADQFDRTPIKDPEQWALWAQTSSHPDVFPSKQITVGDARRARAILAETDP